MSFSTATNQNMTEQEKLNKELEMLLSEITEENLAKMNYDEIVDLRKKLNPYGRTIEGSNRWLTFSFTNLKERYMERLLMTSMIGFLNRACDEYHVPDGIPVIPVYDYVRNPEKLHEFHKDWEMTESLERDIKENEYWMQRRVIIKEFIEYLFQYDPDEHVRSSYKPCPKDIDRSILDTPAANLAINELKQKDLKFREQILEFDRVQHLRAMRLSDPPSAEAAIEHLAAKKLLLPQQHYSEMNFEEWTDEDKNALRTVCEMIPPADIFKHLRTYMEANYDKLREAVLHLYCEKPDFDIAINPYQWHESEEDAVEFQKKHRDEVITDIIKAASGKWNFFAPFERVHSTAKFFNKNTEILEAMVSQIEEDQKLGAELMRKRVVKKKKKNIIEEGPDAEAFTKWKSKNTVLKDMGAENPNADSYADDECPDDAVQVDIIRISKGGLKVEKDKFYTEAVAPEIPPQK